MGLRFAVHNGKTYQEVLITEEMVGRKLGEYVAYVLALSFPKSLFQLVRMSGWIVADSASVQDSETLYV